MFGLRKRLDSSHERLSSDVDFSSHTLPRYNETRSQRESRTRSLSRSLQILVHDYEAEGLISHAAVAKVLARRLNNVERDRIILPKKSSMPLRGKMQILAEESIGSAIDWWPLPEPNRNFVDCTRVSWSCRCGAQHCMDIPDSLAYKLRVLLGTGVDRGSKYGLTAADSLITIIVTSIMAYQYIGAVFARVMNVFKRRRSLTTGLPLPMAVYPRGDVGIGIIPCFAVGIGITVFRTLWTRVLISMLGVSELLATNLLENTGITFWFDVPNWVQVPGLCPNLQCDQSPLQYNATVIASSPNHAAINQAQQTTNSLNAQNIQSPPMQNSSNLPRTPSSSAGLSSGHTTPNQASQPSPNQQQPVPSELHVFMTSKVGGHYLLSQWNTLTPRPQNDRDFFKELRKCYISARGNWRYHFGFKVFSHCEFYRLKKYGPSTFSISTKDLPECKDCAYPQQPCAEHKNYHYVPKPATHNPPLDPEEFYIHFHACQHQRVAHAFRWHRCRHVPTTSNQAVCLIPRRETPLDVDLDNAEIFWGLLVKEKYSILAIVIYNLLAMTPSLAFLFWWIFGSSEKDLSNGSVPAVLTLAGLSLFWAIIMGMKLQVF